LSRNALGADFRQPFRAYRQLTGSYRIRHPESSQLVKNRYITHRPDVGEEKAQACDIGLITTATIQNFGDFGSAVPTRN
jgi:hypothetical protein